MLNFMNITTVYCVLNKNTDLIQLFLSKEDCYEYLTAKVTLENKDMKKDYDFPCWVYPRKTGYNNTRTFPTYTVEEFIRFVKNI
jgi:hypothetical protein